MCVWVVYWCVSVLLVLVDVVCVVLVCIRWYSFVCVIYVCVVVAYGVFCLCCWCRIVLIGCVWTLLVCDGVYVCLFVLLGFVCVFICCVGV